MTELRDTNVSASSRAEQAATLMELKEKTKDKGLRRSKVSATGLRGTNGSGEIKVLQGVQGNALTEGGAAAPTTGTRRAGRYRPPDSRELQQVHGGDDAVLPRKPSRMWAACCTQGGCINS